MAKAKVIKLRRMGYRRTSNKHCLLARIDRPDWKKFMADGHSPWSTEEGMEWVDILSSLAGCAEDFYRRCISKDKITVSSRVSKEVGSSDWDDVGYIDIGD